MLEIDQRRVAYFSMEVGLSSKIPTYSGGLGILAGDTLKSAADNSFPMVGITLLNKHGYLFQSIQEGVQHEEPVAWRMDDFLEPLDAVVEVKTRGETIKVGAWLSNVKGIEGFNVPVIFLTTDLEGNSDTARVITDQLYGVGHKYRLMQELILGFGGMRMLEALGFKDIEKYHMNEGHSAFLVLELKRKLKDIKKIKEKCVFTTHTPVSAGHDRFDIKTLLEILNEETLSLIPIELLRKGDLNMTLLAMEHSDFINGVAKKHAEISREMFPQYEIHSITNGVHAQTWVSPHFRNIYDKYVPNWKQDPGALREISAIDKNEIWSAHFEAKKQIIDYANATVNAGMDYDYFTLGWARRITAYKRPKMLLENVERLHEISQKVGPIQIIYGGKAHPQDSEGKALITELLNISKDLKNSVHMVFIENYDMYISRFMTSGVDVWLNTPQPPYEASGTSGMKCALNGVPQLGVLDGWWHEGCIEGETGWSFSCNDELYDLLENKVMNLFYNDRDAWTELMIKTIMMNGSFFTGHRMINDYMNLAYNA